MVSCLFLSKLFLWYYKDAFLSGLEQNSKYEMYILAIVWKFVTFSRVFIYGTNNK